MASAVRKLTGVGGDIRKIARLLQKEAPPGHMLAYINQEEADLLKARGGSGKPHADTGVPSFEEDPYTYLPDFKDNSQWNYKDSASTDTSPQFSSQSVAPLDLTSGQAAAPQAAAPQTASPFAAYERATTPDTARYFQENQAAGAAPKIDLGQDFAAPQSAEGKTSFIAADATKPDFYAENRALNAGTPTKPGFWEGMTDNTKARLGIGGIEAIIGAYQTNQAMEQARKYREDIAKTAQPYQQQGKDLIAKAQSGELSPAAQQTLQAAQAQAAQGAQSRGGVGAQQAQAQVEGLRQQLLQQQYDYGLKVLGIGDSIAVGAIKAGMQADQYANQLASNYTMNIARTVAGTPSYSVPQQSGYNVVT